MNKIAIIQARMGSSRLKGKVLADIQGKEMLWHVVRRVKASKKVDKTVVATTTEKEDDIIRDFCLKNDIYFYRGSSDDVLARYFLAAEKFNADLIIRVTADCPLIDFDPTGSYSWSFWVRYDNPGMNANTPYLVSKTPRLANGYPDGTNLGYSINGQPGGAIGLCHPAGGAACHYGPALGSGKWQYVVVTKDGSSVQYYIDGELFENPYYNDSSGFFS